MITRTLYAPALVVALAMGLVLGACASSPPVRYYTLSAAPVGNEPPAAVVASPPPALVGPFELPAYLDRPQIATRRSGNELSYSEYARWAEPLQASFAATLAADVRGALPGRAVYAFPAPGGEARARRAYGRVQRFDVDAAGVARLEVQWAVVDADGHPVGPAREAHYEAKAAAPDDYGAVVAALSDTIQQFARDVAAGFVAP